MNTSNNNQPKSLITQSIDLPINTLYQILTKNPNLINIIDNKGETLLSYSIKRKKIDVCQLILTSKILDLSYQDKNGNSYLHLAVMKQLEGIVKALIEKGIYINMQNNEGNTPLHYAYLYNNIPIIHILKNNHIDIKIKNNDNKIAEDLRLNKENNDKLEIENKEKKEKKNKSNKKNKEIKFKIPDKNEKNQIKISTKILNNINVKPNSTNKKNKANSGNNSIKKILNKNYNNNSNSAAYKTNINKNILKNFTNSLKNTEIDKKEKNKIISNTTSPDIIEKKTKRDEPKKILKKSKKILNENYINNNKKVNYINLDNNTSGETKYKSGTYKEKINNIKEQEQAQEIQKININNNNEDDIFNIAESIDYKQKLAHTSELNTQIVKSPIYNIKKNRNYFQEEDLVNINNDDIINNYKNKDNDNDNDNKIIIDEEINNNEDYNEECEDNENNFDDDDNECYNNNFIFEDTQKDRNNKINEEEYKYNEDEIREQNKSYVNYFENSIIKDACKQKKQKLNNDNEYQEKEKEKEKKEKKIFKYNEENKKHNTKKIQAYSNFYRTKNDEINNKKYFNTYINNDLKPQSQARKTFSSRAYNNNNPQGQFIQNKLNPYSPENYQYNYINILNTNNNILNLDNNNNNYNREQNINDDNYNIINNNNPSNIPEMANLLYNKAKINAKINTSNEEKLKNCNPLKEFLSQINLLKYMNNFIQSGFDDINLIIDQAQRGIYIKDNELKEAGITIPGDRAKILIRIQEKAGNFGFAVPKNVYYVCNDLTMIDNDENIGILNNWLKNLKIENYLMNFIYNGYHSIELLLLQMESKNPLTVEILKNEIGIDKIGHRSRIINKLKDEGRSYNNKLKTSVLIVGNGEKNKFCDCLIF